MTTTPDASGLTDFYGPFIHTYTREQAIADAVLVDVTATAKQAGFTCPVALTAGAWAGAVAWTQTTGLQDEEGRLWDVLTMARHAIARSSDASERLAFRVLGVPNRARATTARPTSLVIHAGPGDVGELVITIMLPEED